MKDLTKELLTDAQQMAKDNPDTFEAPATEDLDSIKEGSFVKICAAESERFWVKVTRVEDNLIEGTVDNQLIYSDEHGLDLGDIIKCEKKHVYQTMEP